MASGTCSWCPTGCIFHVKPFGEDGRRRSQRCIQLTGIHFAAGSHTMNTAAHRSGTMRPCFGLMRAFSSGALSSSRLAALPRLSRRSCISASLPQKQQTQQVAISALRHLTSVSTRHFSSTRMHAAAAVAEPPQASAAQSSNGNSRWAPQPAPSPLR
jgi:hypothetical protein